MAKELFGTDGIRGEPGKPPLDDATLYATGRALGTYLAKKNRAPRVMIGMDTRESGPHIAALLAAGLNAAGTETAFAGVITTPGVACLVRQDGFQAGVVISASHNPFQDNGVKLFSHAGMKFPDAIEEELEQDIFTMRAEGAPKNAPVPQADESLDAQYLDFLRSRMIPGEYLFDGDTLELNAGRLTVEVEVNNTGVDNPSDDYYRRGLYEASDEVVRLGCLLTSQTPRQELSGFLAERGHRWLERGRRPQAVESFAWAWALHPQEILLRNRLLRTMSEWRAELLPLAPPGYPPLHHISPPRRFPDTVPLSVERDILCLEASENILHTAELNEKWWEPMRQGLPVTPKPSAAIIVCRPSGGCDVRFHVN